jgi:integrase
MAIRKLPSGSFQARLTIAGRKYAETFASRQEAQEWEIVTRARAITGSLPGRLTVREYSARWLLGYATAPRNTRVFHETNLKRINDTLGQFPVAKVTPSDVTRMLNQVMSSGTPALAERVYRTASAMFGSAAADGLCPVGSPVRSKRHRPRRQRNDHPVLERRQARQVLLQLGGWQRDTALIQLGLGARYGEIAGLTPTDIDLHRGLVHIRRRYSAHGNTVRATKNHRRRTLEMPQILRSPLERLLLEAGDPPPLPELEDRELDATPFRRRWLIQTATGRPPSLTAYNRALAAACAASQVPHISSHGLRHTYVSWMIDEGHSADKIAFWIGDTPHTVRLVYSHMLEGSSAPAAAAIDHALGHAD